MRISLKDHSATKKALAEKLKAEQERIAREIAEVEAKQLAQLGALVAKAGGDQLAPKELLGLVLDGIAHADEEHREAWTKLAELTFPEARGRKAAERHGEVPEASPVGFGDLAAE